MFNFILRKMLSNKWMIISLLVGNIFLCSMVASVPFYSDAILQRVLVKQLSDLQNSSSRYPGTAEISVNARSSAEIGKLEEAEMEVRNFVEAFGVDFLEETMVQTSSSFKMGENKRLGTMTTHSLKMQMREELENHVKMVSGRMFEEEPVEGCIEVIVSEKTLSEQDLILGEEFTLVNLKDENGEFYKFIPVGIYKNSEESDLYWLYSPSSMEDIAIMSEKNFKKVFYENFTGVKGFTSNYYYFLNYEQFDSALVPEYISLMENKAAELSENYSINACRLNFKNAILGFVSQEKELNITLWVMLVPIFVLLAFFIFMVSKQILEQDKNTIAVIKSRGASRSQIMVVFVVQSAIIALISLAAGIPLGSFICRTIGAANDFLALVQRSALKVRLRKEVFYYTGIAALLSVLTMIIPVFMYSRITIVDHKRSTNRKTESFIVVKMAAAAALVGVALYGYYSYNNQKSFLIEGGGSIDALLFISSSLFIIGAGMLIAMLIPLLIKLIYAVGKKRWSPALYASFLNVTHSVGDQRFIMIFMVLTIATGIFNASTARTVNLNTKENLYYKNGADMVLREEWRDNSGLEGASMRVYTEPDFRPYEQLAERNDIRLTKVLNDNRFTVSTQKNVRVMGITTTEFADVAWMRDGLLPVHWYNYLNALASDAQAVLVSDNFRTQQGYSLGDYIRVKNENDTAFLGIICGFVDYWPTYFNRVEKLDMMNQASIQDEYIVIANLAQLQSVWSITPYEVWISTDNPSAVYDFAQENGIVYERFVDTAADFIEKKNDPSLQGTNGVLTVGFIIVLLVCMTGFLIFWILSIRGRTLQFGIFRAMGMRMWDIIKLLVNEQVLISFSSIAAGVLVGWLASKLFVPLIQLSRSSMLESLPLVVASEASDYGRMFIVVGIMLAVCMIVLGVLVKCIKIAQALKLGED